MSTEPEEPAQTSRIPMQRNGDYLVVQLPENPNENDVRLMCPVLLERLHDSPLHGVIFDCTHTKLLDSIVAERLNETARPVALLGCRAAICGLSPGLSSALTRLGVSLASLSKAQDLDRALALLAGSRRAAQ